MPSGGTEGGSPAERLIAAVQDLSMAASVAELHLVLQRAARRLLQADGSSLVVVADGSMCHYVGEEGLGPGWRGRKLPVDGCVAGWCVSSGKAVVISDVRADLRLPVAPYWSTPVTAVAAVPIRSRRPMGALVVHWTHSRTTTADEVRLLQALADSASVALQSVSVQADLERRVRERTSELERLNTRLQREVIDRKRAEAEVRKLSLVDELTGLYNRRGFMLLAGRELKALQRSGRRALVLYIDLDGLKQANDSMGHDAGDRLIQRAAAVLASVARETDVTARLGGDEFAVFMTLGYDHPPVHLIVERFIQAAASAGVKWSVGATATPPDRIMTLGDLLSGADEAMYRGRKARRSPTRVAARH